MEGRPSPFLHAERVSQIGIPLILDGETQGLGCAPDLSYEQPLILVRHLSNQRPLPTLCLNSGRGSTRLRRKLSRPGKMCDGCATSALISLLRGGAVAETRKLAAILCLDIVGYSRLAGADEDRILARLRALRSDLIDPTIAVHHGRVVKRTGDGAVVEFRSVVDAVRCAVEVQNAMLDRNAGLPTDRRIEFRMGIHAGDVVEESDGDLMGDGVNIAARLEGIAEPGGICASEDAFRQVRDKLRAEFIDLGDRNLKNIARPVRVYAIKPEGAAPMAASREPSGPPHLSIVVLPFANIGGDVDQEYFVDGVTESLTTDISRMPGMLVIGRNTAFAYKGNSSNLKQIGRELNVRYVLEGSVQRGGNRMRVNVQLIDAETGNHIWAERFDKAVANLFEMQDEIVARLSNSLNTQLITAEARRAERTPRPDSMDHYFQGMAWLNKGFKPEYLSRSESCLGKALWLDSNNVEALVGIALVNCLMVGLHFSDDRPSRLAAAEGFASRALFLAPEHPLGRTCLGLAYMYSNRAEEGIAQCEQALAANRNLALAHGFIGMAKWFVGRAEESEAHIEEAFRLSPRDTNVYYWTGLSGIAKIFLGKYDEAVPILRRSIDIKGIFPAVHFYLGAAFAELGRLDEARIAVANGLAIEPTFSIRRYRDTAPSDNPRFMKTRERLYIAMRIAGVPEE
jgi:TolB-like protein